jgi:cytochrome P450
MLAVYMGSDPIDLGDPLFWDDPHPVLRAAREQRRVAETTTGIRLVLRHDDVEALSKDPRLLGGSVAMLTRHGMGDGDILVDWWKRNLANRNGAEHLRLRALVSRAFTPRAVDAVRPRIRELARELIDRHAASGTMDLLDDFAHELPIRLMCEMLGIDPDVHADFARWTTNLGLAFVEVMSDADRAGAELAVRSLQSTCRELIAQRVQHGHRDDLLSALIREAEASPEPFDPADIVTLVVNLLFGGHDTSRSMLSISALIFLQHRDQLERMRKDPRLVASAAEECLRFEPVIGMMGRTPAVDVQIGDVTLCAGEMVGLSILSASRDPSVFERPDEFDIGRSGQRSFAFGWGPHHCLGAALARAELQEAITALFEHCREIELVDPAPAWVPFTAIRRLKGLPVRFSL